MTLFTKDFWGFVWNSLKGSKFLIIKDVIVMVYLLLSSVIANRLELVNLTYFNSIIIIGEFFHLFSFGLSNGLGIHINQNHKNKNKIENYILAGRKIIFVIAVIGIIALGVSYKFILHDVLDLPTSIDYKFYFLMLIYMFIEALATYFDHILRHLKRFKEQFVGSIIRAVGTVGGLGLSWWLFNLDLISVAVVYISINVVRMIYLYQIYLCNKDHEINIFSPRKTKLKKDEISNIINLSVMESMWQICNIFIGFFILNLSEVYFNQYNYFDDVMPIFRIFYFPVIQLSSIAICRHLGDGDFDSAYKTGKNSMWYTVVVSAGLMGLGLALGPLIFMGMNVDILQSVQLALILYLILAVIRLFNWNISSYILVQGGKTKLISFIEICKTVFYIILFLVSDFIPSNLFIIYGIMIAVTIIDFAICMVLFVRKKWMQKLNTDK